MTPSPRQNSDGIVVESFVDEDDGNGTKRHNFEFDCDDDNESCDNDDEDFFRPNEDDTPVAHGQRRLCRAGRTTFFPHPSIPLGNFLLMSVLFSANHATVSSCLSLATPRLGDAVGGGQSAVLYLTYTLSSVLGATYVVNRLGPRDALVLGTGLYCLYVGCFLVATVCRYNVAFAKASVYIGAAVGGIGGGFLWTAQGSFFARAAKDHAAERGLSDKEATSALGGWFACVYLTGEVLLKLLSSFLVEGVGAEWSWVFGLYTLVAVTSSAGMGLLVRDCRHRTSDANGARPDITIGVDDDIDDQRRSAAFRKVTAAWDLLVSDPKMKHLAGLNAAFGISSAFVNSFVNGAVIPIALGSGSNGDGGGEKDTSGYVGSLSALTPAVAALVSVPFGELARRAGKKGPVLIIGAVAFFLTGFVFAAKPRLDAWDWTSLAAVYSILGIGRATFEGTLRATFADYFPGEERTEGAFANIVLQNGLSSAAGFALSTSFPCDVKGTYCVEYRDGSMHNVLAFEVIVMITALWGIMGYWRASVLKKREGKAYEARLSTYQQLT